METKNRPKIRALLVGINEYRSPSIQEYNLKHCISDVEKMANMLQNSYAADVITMTSNKQDDLLPTKSGIIKQFQKHLITDIKAGEIALFYFSGHGSRECAHDLFKQDGKDHIQVLICQDSTTISGETFLADKELRYLIRKVHEKCAETIVITDCCHSGNGTRNEQDSKERVKLFIPDYDIAARDWNGFCFAEDENLSDYKLLEGRSINDWLPEGQHIHLSASEQNQFAFETDDHGGLFTHALVECVQKYNGKISYHFLNQYIRFNVQRTHAQTPLMVPVSLSENRQLPFRQFLGNQNDIVIESISECLVHFDNKWVVDTGGIYGLSNDQEISYSLRDELGEVAKVKVDKVGGVKSSLKLSAYPDVKMEETYTLNIPNLLHKALKLWIAPEIMRHATNIHKALEYASFAEITDQPESAQILISDADRRDAFLVRDQKDKFNPQEWDKSLSTNDYLLKINWISQWYFLFELANTQSKISNNSLIKSFHKTNPNKLSLSLSNQSQKDLFVSVFLITKELKVEIVKARSKELVRQLTAFQVDIMWHITLDSTVPSDQQHLLILVSESRFEVDYFGLTQTRNSSEKKVEPKHLLDPDWFTWSDSIESIICKLN